MRPAEVRRCVLEAGQEINPVDIYLHARVLVGEEIVIRFDWVAYVGGEW